MLHEQHSIWLLCTLHLIFDDLRFGAYCCFAASLSDWLTTYYYHAWSCNTFTFVSSPPLPTPPPLTSTFPPLGAEWEHITHYRADWRARHESRRPHIAGPLKERFGAAEEYSPRCLRRFQTMHILGTDAYISEVYWAFMTRRTQYFRIFLNICYWFSPLWFSCIDNYRHAAYAHLSLHFDVPLYMCSPEVRY